MMSVVGESPNARAILILGTGKSGTTGLFASIKAGFEQALGQSVRAMFEPHTAAAIEETFSTPIVVKMLLERLARTDRNVISRFDRRVLIVRDPRDCLISRLVWQPCSLPGVDTPAKMRVIVDLLRQKESDPQSIGVYDLYRTIGTLAGVPSWIKGAERFAYLPLHLSDALEGSVFRLKYEDYVEQRTALVSDYLGFSLVHRAPPPQEHAMTFRTGGHGHWRRWFTVQDHERFTVERKDDLRALGYADFDYVPWTEPLPASEGSEYLLRHFRQRRPELVTP